MIVLIIDLSRPYIFLQEIQKLKIIIAIYISLVLGPLLSPTISASASLLLNIFNNKIGKIPDTYKYICDVRDVALANM